METLPLTATLSLTQLQTADEIDRLDLASLRILAHSLWAQKAELERLRGLEAEVASLGDRIRWRPEDNLNSWSERVLTALAEACNLLQASLYLAYRSEGAGLLVLAGAYAAAPEQAQARINWGEGLLGQVAKSKRTRVFSEGAELVPRALTGLAKVEPKALMLHPLLYNGEVEGVLEAAAAQAFTDSQLELIQRMSESLAANLLAIRNQEEMKRLYAEAQDNAARLAAQEEEMRQNMEELQATQEEMLRRQESLVQAMKDLEEERDRRVQLQERTKKMVNDMMIKHKAREEELLARIRLLEEGSEQAESPS